MQASILGLLAETSIHPGAGQDAGFVDLPVAREAATDYPVIVGSSFKGALLDRARAENWDDSKRDKVLGRQDHAGSLVVSDARLILLPVRSLTSQYKWVTCPHLLERLQRDQRRAGLTSTEVEIPKFAELHCLGADDGELYLEERQFTNAGPLPDDVRNSLESLIATESHAATRKRLADQVVILNDSDFAWFARYGLAINARNVLHNEKKTSENLWYEETIPPDSLFYSLLCDRNGGGSLDDVKSLFADHSYIQVGGNETVGQGWFAVTVLNEARPEGAAK